MAIRVPTGLKEVTITASAKRYIAFKCVKCGKDEVAEYDISSRANAQYHIFQSGKVKQKRTVKANEHAHLKLIEYDKSVFRAINIDHNYEVIHQVIECSQCHEKQPWSTFPGGNSYANALSVIMLLSPFVFILVLLSFVLNPIIGVLFCLLWLGSLHS